MKKDDCYQLGEVIKTHGLRGEVSILLDVDHPQEYQELESVFLLKEGKLIPFFIDTIQINAHKALVKFEEVDAIEEASELVKCEAYLPLTYLPELPKGAYYFHDLVGCQVFENDVLIGAVVEVIDLNGNELLHVDHKGKEVLIPIKDEILQEVLIGKGRLNVNLPDGLLDL